MIFAAKQKKRKVKCAGFPQRAYTISQTVCAEGATFFKEIARTPNKRTWMVAPDAYLHYYKSQMIKVWVSLCIFVFQFVCYIIILGKSHRFPSHWLPRSRWKSKLIQWCRHPSTKKRVVVDSFESIAEIPLPAGIIRFRMVNMRTNIKRWGVGSAGSLWRVINKIIQSNYRHEYRIYEQHGTPSDDHGGLGEVLTKTGHWHHIAKLHWKIEEE